MRASPAPPDLAAATAFLATRYDGDAPGVAEIGRGEWARAYGFTHQGAAFVVRFGHEREDFEKDRIAAGYASPRLPIPRLIEIGEAFDGYYAISERAFGTHLDKLDEPSLRAALPSLLIAYDAMREADVAHTRGYGMWGATGNAPYATWPEALLSIVDAPENPRIAGWREQLDGSPEGRAAFDEAAVCLRNLAPSLPAERHLVHSDPLNGNILVRDGRVSAILDWGCGMYGDFVYDLAHLSFWMEWFPAQHAIDIAGEAEGHYEAIGLRVPNFRERIRACEIHIGLDAMAYNAFRRRQDELPALARRTVRSVRA
ncbi:MAG: aminoglycoside phosphotransferase family protein [Dehalococcoidia bacterium]